MSTEMVNGQIYRVGFTGRSECEITTVECLLVATSTENAKLRFPYVIDLSEFTSYRIDYVAKEPGRAYIIKRKIEKVSQENPDAVVKRNEGSFSVWQSLPATNGKKWQVNAMTTCFAKNEKDAIRKLSERISGGSENVLCVAEELAVKSGFAVAKDVSMFNKASFVRG